MSKLIPGVNDLATEYPAIADQWHPTKNGDLTPKNVTSNSHKKAWWLGVCGHEWDAPVADRKRGRGCPICKGKRVVAGINDLATTHPQIAAQWHPTLNKTDPTKVLPYSNKPAWWICDKGHEFKASPAHRIFKKIYCPFCNNKQVLIGFNDLATTHPEIAAQWHPTKNTLTPQQVTIGADKMIWWICDESHEWQALVYSRKHNGCPYCSGHKIWVGFNDLQTTHPQLAADWHPSRNGNLTPCDVTAGSNRKAWWLGQCGHEWEATISSRSSGCGCPLCDEEKKTSFTEKAVYFYVSQCFPDAVSSQSFEWLGRRNLDIYIPSLSTAIEYDGSAWHQDFKRDEEKNTLCTQHGVRIIRIREYKCPSITGECIPLKSNSPAELAGAIESLLTDWLHTDINFDIDLNRDKAKIIKLVQQNSVMLSERLPHIAEEWHPFLNEPLKPNQISYGSNKKVWWQCKQGHSWKDSCNHRAQGRGCPVCGRINRQSSSNKNTESLDGQMTFDDVTLK